MSATAFLQLRAALVAHLLAAPALADGRVRTSTRPIAQGEANAITVRLSDAQASHAVIEAADWQTALYIECAARSQPGGTDADTAADALLSDVFARLHTFAASAAAKAAGVLEVDQDAVVEWDTVHEDVPYTSASLRITAVHRTPATTLQPWT